MVSTHTTNVAFSAYSIIRNGFSAGYDAIETGLPLRDPVHLWVCLFLFESRTKETARVVLTVIYINVM